MQFHGHSGGSPNSAMADGRIYVGNLPTDVQERDIEDLFFKFGKIRDIELKNNRGTIPFAFVRFEDPRDAEDAVYGRNGYGFGDCKLRVEYPRSSASKFTGPMGGGPRGRFGPPTRRSEFRVIVTGLPPTGSWQDLKDHMREAGDVCFADVQRDGEGVVEFLRREDMEYALRRLDRTEFRSHQGETSFIRVTVPVQVSGTILTPLPKPGLPPATLPVPTSASTFAVLSQPPSSPSPCTAQPTTTPLPVKSEVALMAGRPPPLVSSPLLHTIHAPQPI
uniref:Serine/arginine-rich splicing factor 9 n=2 Tax=Paramormyrops kingsleyae TaxID=1676925 RepID=A0A3B3QPX7_9TELE